MHGRIDASWFASFAAAFLAATTFSATTHAQTITPLVEVGDAIPGGGVVDDVMSVGVNRLGEWIAVVDGDPGAATQHVLLRDGIAVVREGDALPGFPGEAVGPFLYAPDFGTSGGWVLTLNAPAPSLSNALCADGVVVVRRGDPCTAPQVPVGTVFYSTSNAWSAGDGERFLARCLLTFPDTDVYWAIVAFTDVGGTGTYAQEVVVLRDEVLPGQTSGVTFLGTGPLSHDLSRFDHHAFAVLLSGPPTSALYGPDGVVAEEGAATGFAAGETWQSALLASVDLNNRVQLAHRLYTDPLGDVIVLDGREFARVGGAVPGRPAGSTWQHFGFEVGPFGEQGRPLALNDMGELCFYASWFEPVNGGRSGIVVESQVVVERDVTAVAGSVVSSFAQHGSAIRMSDDGTYVAFVAELQGGSAGAFLVDRGLRPYDFCAGDGQQDLFGATTACPCSNESPVEHRRGCENSQGRGAFVTVQGSLSVAAGDTTFRLHDARANQPAMLLQGTTPISLPFRDGILCMGSPTERIEVLFTDATGFAQSASDVAAEGAVGASDFRGYQVWYRDPSVSSCGTGSIFTVGVIGAWL